MTDRNRRIGPDERRRAKLHHVHPIPDQIQHPVKYRLLQARWRLALWAVVYPVQLALVVALAVCAIPLYLVLQQQAVTRRTAEATKAQAAAIQKNRILVIQDICAQLDRNARTSNAQLELFKGIIVDSVKQSKPFERSYRSLGLPPYKTRLKSASRTARRIDHLKLPLPNCNKAIFRIQNTGHR